MSMVDEMQVIAVDGLLVVTSACIGHIVWFSIIDSSLSVATFRRRDVVRYWPRSVGGRTYAEIWRLVLLICCQVSMDAL